MASKGENKAIPVRSRRTSRERATQKDRGVIGRKRKPPSQKKGKERPHPPLSREGAFPPKEKGSKRKLPRKTEHRKGYYSFNQTLPSSPEAKGKRGKRSLLLCRGGKGGFSGGALPV